MSKKRITLKDIAKELNLAPSTISRALKNHPGISAKTKKIVKDKVEESGFTPDFIASSFRNKKTRSIGVIVPKINIHFHSLVISGIEECAYRSGYNVTIFQSQDSYNREKEIIKILHNKMVEGIIVCLAMETINYDHFKKLEKLKVPLVFYDRIPDDLEANKVAINDFESAFKATEHLIKIGCRRIAHIAGLQSTGIFKARANGYLAALKKYNLPIEPELLLETKELSYAEGVACAKKFLSQPEIPDGIFCANDYTAVSVVQIFNKAHIKIPQELAVVGFSNYPISEIIEPQLSTINDRAFQMGQSATKLLISQIEEENQDIIKSQSIILKTELIIRDSSRR
jgi:LacI family transcriptional regulator